MMNLTKTLGLSTLVLGGAMGATVLAQAPATDQSAPPAATQSAPANTNEAAPANSNAQATDQSSTMNPNDSTTYATGKPLAGESKEGFWGHMNPFARKKWVKREIDPIRDRENELDQLQAKNANDIKDVDRRATAGINKAMEAANTADQHAADAANRANAAQTTATQATSRTEALNGTVSNLDQYQQVSSVDVKFAHGRTTLGPQGKEDLDQVASKLNGEKGYIIEIQGYSRGGVQSSQAMADSVARYLVTEKQVPLYRIYRTGLGRERAEANNNNAEANNNAGSNTASNTEEQKPLVNGVRVTVLHNSLASMSEPNAATNGNGTLQPGQANPNGEMNTQPAPASNQ